MNCSSCTACGGDEEISLASYRLGEDGSIQIQMRALKELADMIMRLVSIICYKA